MGLLSGIVGGAGAALGLYQANEAKKDAKKAGKESAAIERRVTAEQLRQLDRDRREMLGTQTVNVAASGFGFDPDSSQSQLREDMAREFALTRQFTGEVGASNANAVEQAGRDTGDRILNTAIADALNITSNILGSL